MKSKKSKFIEREFNKLSKYLEENDFSKIVNENKIFCPICQKAKNIESFTEEHIKPDSVGGTSRTITCKTCNSRCGHEFDYAVINFLNHSQLHLERPNGKAQVIVDDITVNAVVENLNGSPCVTVNERNNNPIKWKEIQDKLDKPRAKFRLDTSSKWSPKKLCRALIKFAHLMSLPQENYRYVLNDCGKKVSEIILGKYNEDITKFVKIIPYVKTNHKISEGYYSVLFDTIEIRLCFVDLYRKTKQDHMYFLVILPGDCCTWSEFIACRDQIIELSKDHSLNILLDNESM